MKRTILYLLLVPFLLLQFKGYSQDKIERIEPPFWWAGMKNPNLQLMVYGKGIHHLTPVIPYQGRYP